MPRTRRRNPRDSHVRMYAWELDSPAYRTLSTDARALLIEFRALYKGAENRVFMSVRQMQKRLGDVGQRRATNARDELLERGWIALIEPGGFTRKTRHAAVYRLTNQPTNDADGSPTTMDFMRWKPNPEKASVARAATGGSCSDCDEAGMAAFSDPRGSQPEYRPMKKLSRTVVEAATQILIPSEIWDGGQ